MHGLVAACVGGFTPASLPGRLVDLDPDAITGVAIDAAVASFTDTSGNSNHGAQATGAKQGLLRAAGINGKRTVQIDGVDDGYLTPALTFGPFTLALIVKLSGTAGMVCEAGTSVSWLYGSTGQTLIATRTGTSSKDRAANWAVDGAVKVLVVEFDGTHAGHTLSINGTTQSMTSVSSSNPGTATVSHALAVGWRATGSLYTTGHFRRVVLYDRVHSAAQKAQLIAFLRADAGV